MVDKNRGFIAKSDGVIARFEIDEQDNTAKISEIHKEPGKLTQPYALHRLRDNGHGVP